MNNKSAVLYRRLFLKQLLNRSFLAGFLLFFGNILLAESIHYFEAKKKFDKGEYLLAMLAAQRALKEDGEQAGYRYLYGVILTELKQFSEAEIHLRKAVSLEPANAEFQYRLGTALLDQGQIVMKLRSMRVGLHLSRSEGIDPEGLKVLEKTVELDSNHLEARIRLGKAYTDQNRFDETLVQFKAVAQKAPRYPQIHSHLAVLYLELGMAIKAIQELAIEVSYYPDNAMAHLDLGDLLLQLAQPKLALNHLLAAKEKSPDTPDLHYALAKAYRSLKQPKKALASALKCVALSPQSPSPRYLLSQLYHQNNQTDLARKELSIADKLKNQLTSTYRPPRAM